MAPPPPAAPPPESLGPVLDFLRRLWAVDHALHTLSKRMETQLGLTSPQRLVVRIVGRFPGISAGQLAGILHVHPSTLTGVLSRLEERGLVSRRADPGDLRRALFTLTARGRARAQPRSGTVEAALEGSLAVLPERNIRIAEQVLAQIADALALDLPLPPGRRPRQGVSARRPSGTSPSTAAVPRGRKPPSSREGAPVRTAPPRAAASARGGGRARAASTDRPASSTRAPAPAPVAPKRAPPPPQTGAAPGRAAKVPRPSSGRSAAPSRALSPGPLAPHRHARAAEDVAPAFTPP